MRRSLAIDSYAAVGVTLALATLLTGFRFWARRITKVKLWWDDYFAAVAYLTGLGFSAVVVAWTYNGGLGQEIATLDISQPEAVKRSLLYLFNVELMYAFSLAFSKYAILGMYWRLFSTSPIRIAIQVLFVMSVIWVVIRTFMTIFHCVPVQAFWDKTIPDATCKIENSKFFFGTTMTHLLLDVAILVLPIMQVGKLKLKTGQKIGVIALFMFGTIVCVASIVLVICATSFDANAYEMPYDISSIIIPATVEVNFAIVSAHLPMMRPIVRRLLPGSAFSSGDPSSGRAYARSGTNGGVGTGTAVKLRTLTRAIELDDDSSTKNFSDRHFSSRNNVDMETASSGSSENGAEARGTYSGPSQAGPKTVIETGTDRPGTGKETLANKGIHVKNEMSISYESK